MPIETPIKDFKVSAAGAATFAGFAQDLRMKDPLMGLPTLR